MDTIPPDAGDEKKDVPQKYIRTFAEDMKAFQKGGTPGLRPLEAKKAAPAPEPQTPIPAPEPKPVLPTPPPAPPLPDEEAGIVIHEDESALQDVPPLTPPSVPEEQTPSPVLQPVEDAPAPGVPSLQKPLVPTPEPLAPETPFTRPEGPLPIETYGQDFRNHMRDTNASTATVLAAEQDAHTTAAEEPEKHSRVIWYILGGLMLVIGSGIGVYVAYTQYLVKEAPVITAPTVQTPIFVDSRATVSGSGDALLQQLIEALGEPIGPNSVEALSFDASTSALTTVFDELKIPAPDIVRRNLVVPGSMAGIVNTQNGQSFFFILAESSYSATFSGMLAWEPEMQTDLAALFPLYQAPQATSTMATSTASVATSTPVATSSTPEFLKGRFDDESIENHDVRVYRDSAGHSVLVYGYWNESTLIIARDPAAFTELITRLGTTHS